MDMSDSFVTPWTVARSSVRGISQARILEWVAIPSPGDLPDPGIEPESPALAGRFFTTEPPGKPREHCVLVVQPLSGVLLFATLWTVALQAPLSSTISQSLLKFMCIELVILSNRLILGHPPSPFAFSLSQHQGLFQ